MTRASPGPLLTSDVHEVLLAARASGHTVSASFDLGRTRETIDVTATEWRWRDRSFPFPERVKERTIYAWDGDEWTPVSRYGTALIKLVPTEWGPPTFEIDGIKMLPTAQVSPWADAERKVGLVAPKGKVVLDTCGGLGYFAAWCVASGASSVLSFEKSPDVLWLRTMNPWSPIPDDVLTLTHGDISERISTLPSRSVDAILHDPPRFGIAGELYSQAFYDELARVIRPRGRLFHYTGSPNKLTSGRDVPLEVSKRLTRAGFKSSLDGDGVVGIAR
ncbi:MAG: SAM-dependent methyltransferase [Myxococcales bacterium]|nr:SAM-dependent methyltransferase [Myxococcales bacterium]